MPNSPFTLSVQLMKGHCHYHSQTIVLLLCCLIIAITLGSYGECSSSTTIILSQVNWNNITASELQAVDPSVFASVSASDIASIPPSACGGFRSEQITRLTEDGCAGFTPSCFANIPALAFSGFTSPCVLNIRTDATAMLSYNQLGSIQPDSLTGLTASQLSSISPATCAAFSKPQLTRLTSTVMFDTCIGFSKACFFNISLNSLSGFEYSCFSKIPAAILVFMDSQRFSKLSDGLVSYIEPPVFQLFDGEVCAGFSANKLSMLPYQTCMFTELCIANIPPKAMSGMNALCMESIPNAGLRGLTADLIRNIPSKAFTLVSSSQLAQIYKYKRKELFEGLSLDQAQSIDFLVVSQMKQMFSSYQLQSANNLPTEMRQLNWLQLASTSAVYTSKFTSDDIPKIPTYSFSGFLEVQVNQMSFNIFANATDGQVSAFDCASVSGLRADQISQISSHFICALQSPAFVYNCIQPSTFSGLTIPQLQDGINCGRVFLMDCQQYRSLTREQYHFLSSYNQTQTISRNCGGPIYVSPAPHHSNPQHSGSSSIFNNLLNIILLITFAFIAIINY